MGIGPMRPTSRGSVELRSAQPEHPLRLDFNYCHTEQDRVAMRECVKLGRELFAQPAFQVFNSTEHDPGAEVKTDKQIDAWVKRHASTAWHPSSTCKMGAADDPNSVVDPQTKVIGVENLRIVDASIMPSMVSSNLNAVVMMMAEYAADIIQGKPPLDAIDAPYHTESEAETDDWFS